MPSRELARRVQETYEEWLSLGTQRTDGPLGTATRSPGLDQIYDANLIAGLKVETAEEMAALLAFADEVHEGLGHRHILAGPETSPLAHSEMAQAGFAGDPAIQLLLRGELQGPSPIPLEIRPVESEEDLRSADRLLRLWHEENNAAPGAKHQLSEETSRQMARSLSAKAPAFRRFLARKDGIDVGFFGSYPGTNGVGMVEDLYTVSNHRHRGVARALIHHCVADARSRGAEYVLIGADPADTPRHFYRALGFEPACITWSYLRTGLLEER